MDQITLREMLKYLPSNTVSSIGQVNSSMNELIKGLDKDWYAWKTKLEEQYGKTFDHTEIVENALDINWRYVYSLFEPGDPKAVALKYPFDVRIVKIAYLLGADYTSDNDKLSKKSISDLIEKENYKPGSSWVEGNIYMECTVSLCTESLRWLLKNLPIPVNVLSRIIASYDDNLNSLDTLLMDVIRALNNSEEKKDGRTEADDVGYILVRNCFEKPARAYGTGEIIKETYEKSRDRELRETMNICLLLSNYKLTSKHDVTSLMNNIVYSHLDSSIVHILADKIDSSLTHNTSVFDIILAAKKYKYLLQWFKEDCNKISKIMVNHFPVHIQSILKEKDNSELKHFMLMISHNI